MKKGKITASLIATSIVLPMSVTIAHADEDNIQQINIEYRTMTANSVNFRKGPSTSYESMGKLNKGYQVEYIGKSGRWVNVKYNGKVGYVYGDYVSTSSNDNTENSNSDNAIKSTKVVNGNSVNFRKGPSTSYSSMGKLNKGTEVGFISESNGWSKISYNGSIGYMSSQYVSNKSENPDQPSDNTDNTIKSTKVVNGNSVNFRKGPSTSYSSMGKLNKGTEVEFISQSNGWSKISYNGNIGYMSSQYLSDKISSNLPSSEKADEVIDFAKKLLGKPYVWGAEGPNSFDCSGFTQYVFKNSSGISIPRVSRDQSKFGQYVSRSQLKKGDLIFFDTAGSNNGYVSHVGIYMGNNQMIHASSGKGKVGISELSSYYNGAFVNARRVL
ncbi:SH3 domain-containing protein [Romboutsia sp.]|uniref:C40 family peptidase n=1 Tax=Romboutsia sp. TaxID=1965302 RepID=UPI002CE212B7|nr:SH3 domain-containing protein [Romboutsia sp.]HSQ89449.1 SH3 domain-containing protein [Romboutsia sp.]